MVSDVLLFFALAQAVIVPLRRGGGTRLNTGGYGRRVPVVSTKLGAEGLEVEDGVHLHLLLADSPQQITGTVSRAATSLELQARLSRAGQALVYRAYEWAFIRQKRAIHESLARYRRRVP